MVLVGNSHSAVGGYLGLRGPQHLIVLIFRLADIIKHHPTSPPRDLLVHYAQRSLGIFLILPDVPANRAAVASGPYPREDNGWSPWLGERTLLVLKEHDSEGTSTDSPFRLKHLVECI